MRLFGVLASSILVIGMTVFVGHHGAFAEDDEVKRDQTTVVKTYRVSDLPVWTSDGKYDPSVLMRLIQVSVPDWDSGRTVSTMAPYPQNASVVISTHSKNHDKIVELLESLRPEGR